MVAKPYNAFTLDDVQMTLLARPLFYVGDRYVTVLGLIAFAGFFAAGLLIARFLQSQTVRRFFSRFKIDINFIAIVTTILSLAAIIFFSVTAINAAGIPLPWNAPLPAIKLSLLQIFLLVALVIAVFWISSRTKHFLFNRLLAQSGLDRSLQYAIAQIVSNIVLVVGIFVVLENTGIHLAALAVFAGAVGVGVGFGLQNIASNFISGLVILAERPITIGDRVEVAGVIGRVQQIRARSTVIITNDNIAMIVPNSKFIDSPVTNWHYGDPRVRFRLPVGVAYGSDVNKVRDALIAAAREHSATLSNPEPTAYLEKFGDSTIDFELVAWTQDMSYKPRRFKSDLNYLIYKHLTAAGIQIPNPQRDIHIRDGVINVKHVAQREEAVERFED
jgi:small-conductance mechanosensitive channel